MVAPVETPGAGPPSEQPGVLSPSVEMPLKTIASAETPSDAAVVARNAAAKAIAAGLVAISSGVR